MGGVILLGKIALIVVGGLAMVLWLSAAAEKDEVKKEMYKEFESSIEERQTTEVGKEVEKRKVEAIIEQEAKDKYETEDVYVVGEITVGKYEVVVGAALYHAYMNIEDRRVQFIKKGEFD